MGLESRKTNSVYRTEVPPVDKVSQRLPPQDARPVMTHIDMEQIFFFKVIAFAWQWAFIKLGIVVPCFIALVFFKNQKRGRGDPLYFGFLRSILYWYPFALPTLYLGKGSHWWIVVPSVAQRGVDRQSNTNACQEG
jgi:hypothetical protein